MAFVVVTHIHPEHESHMAELLQRHTRMPTMQVKEWVPGEPNHVNVIPPNRSIIMTDTQLDTQEFDEPHGRRTPIDHFFRSMAASGHPDLIAVILSGGGTDGASDLTAAEQEERKRISQILHDDLQQRIFAVKVQLSTFYDALQREDSQSAQLDMIQLQALLDESISITRNLSIDLSPAILQGDSLVDALVWLSNQMLEQYGLKVTVESNGVSTCFEDTLRILLFQAVREALFNVVKLAGTLSARVSFKRTDGQIRLTISDDGAGFAANAITDEQAGLLNVRHRLGLMGCRMQINSTPGNGSLVMIDIPDQQVK